MTHLSLPSLKLIDNPFPEGIATRYQGGYACIKQLHHIPEVEILDLAEGNVARHNPLDKGKLPKLEVKHGDWGKRYIFAGRLNWLSFCVNAVFPLPMGGDVRCAIDN